MRTIHPNTTITNYPFGMLMDGRSFTSSDYRFGFGKQEKDDEVKGKGDALSFKYRIYDTRLGRFLSIDPLFKEYPWNSTYAFAENSSIAFIDLEGCERYYAADGLFLGQNGDNTTIMVVSKDYVLSAILQISLANNPNISIDERRYWAKKLESLTKNYSERLTATNTSVQSNVLTTVFRDINKGTKLLNDKIFIKFNGLVGVKGNNGYQLSNVVATAWTYTIFGKDGKSDNVVINVNNVSDSYYDMRKLLEHENTHGLAQIRLRTIDVHTSNESHFNVEYAASKKYKDKMSKDGIDYSKFLLSYYIEDERTERNESAVGSSSYNRKNKSLKGMIGKYEKLYGKYEKHIEVK